MDHCQSFMEFFFLGVGWGGGGWGDGHVSGEPPVIAAL